MKHHTCLVISKDRLFTELLAGALTSQGIDISGCPSTEDGRTEIARNKYDLILVNGEISNAIELITQCSWSDSKWIALVEGVIPLPIEVPPNAIAFPKTAPLGELLLVMRSSLGIEEQPSRGDGSTGIIVVDDDEAIRLLLTAFLQSRGYRTAGAKNGKEALAMAVDQKFRIMILDVNMPEMGGIEVLTALLKQRTHLGIIMLSGIADAQIAAYSMKLGAFDYIMKPFNPAAIESTISACLSHLQYRSQSWWSMAR